MWGCQFPTFPDMSNIPLEQKNRCVYIVEYLRIHGSYGLYRVFLLVLSSTIL